MADTSGTDFVRPALADATKQIRLLRILREDARLGYSDIIRCELSVHTLADVESKYTAISYTWGPESPRRAIIINDHLVRVRMHCWYALWQMRFHDVAGQHCQDDLYWIDSISIDQECHSEKGAQIAQMASIYSCAGLVAVCLGFDGQDTCLFPNRNHGHKQPQVAYALAARALARRSYFQRVWTVQECSLAKKAIAFCGLSRVSWHTISAIIAKTEAGRALQVFFTPATPQSQESLAVFPAKLMQNLNRKCYDPRDKLYGVLHLSRDFARLIQPDYAKGLSEVLLDYVHAAAKLYEWTIGPSFAHMLVNSIRSLSLTFASDSPNFLHELQTMINTGSVDDHGFWHVLKSPAIAEAKPSLVRLRVPVSVHPLTESDSFVPTSDLVSSCVATSSQALSDPSFSRDTRTEPWAMPPTFPQIGQLPSIFTCSRITNVPKPGSLISYVGSGSRLSEKKLRNETFATGLHGIVSKPALAEAIALSFDSEDGLTFIGRRQQYRKHDDERRNMQPAIDNRTSVQAIAESTPGPRGYMDLLRKPDDEKTTILCEFRISPSELLGLSLTCCNHSQLLRVLFNAFFTVRGIDLVSIGDSTEADLSTISASSHEEIAWRSRDFRPPVSVEDRVARTTPLETGPCRQEAFCHCSMPEPTWLSHGNHIESGVVHQPSCPLLQYMTAPRQKKRIAELEEELRLADVNGSLRGRSQK